ncbi:MAG: nucleoside recognition protein [Desulfobacteraceae bacterium]|nr:MAG: nucleoside recognition protein [Desulfobacteraceae bacterium]
MNPSNPNTRPHWFLAVSLTLTTLMLLVSGTHINGFTWNVFSHHLLYPLLRLLVFITIGLCAGIVIEARGWSQQLAVIARPLFRTAKLGDYCGSTFTMAFVSGASANAMLLEFHKQKKIGTLQLYLTNYINQLPAFFLHLPTTFFIILPLTGYAGVFYLLLTFCAVVLRTLCFVIFGKLVLSHRLRDEAFTHSDPVKSDSGREPTHKRIKRILPERMIRIGTWVIPIYSIVMVFKLLGWFEAANVHLSSVIPDSFLPAESFSVIILSFAAEFTSGFAAAGALMNAGILSIKQTVLALLAGNILAFPIRALRHQLPRYMGIFSPRMGLQLLISGQFFRIASLIIVGCLFYLGVPDV